MERTFLTVDDVVLNQVVRQRWAQENKWGQSPLATLNSMLLSSARRRTPTSGDASRAIRVHLAGPSRPDDERYRGF